MERTRFARYVSTVFQPLMVEQWYTMNVTLCQWGAIPTIRARAEHREPSSVAMGSIADAAPPHSALK
jgi:hypothetical protein